MSSGHVELARPVEGTQQRKQTVQETEGPKAQS